MRFFGVFAGVCSGRAVTCTRLPRTALAGLDRSLTCHARRRHRRRSLDEGGIGKAKALLSTLSLLISATVAAPIQRRIGAVATCVLGLSASATGLAGLAIATTTSSLAPVTQLGMFWVAAAVYQVGVPLYGPTVPTMLLQCVPKQRRGAIMGLDGSINTVARIISAPLLGTPRRSQRLR